MIADQMFFGYTQTMDLLHNLEFVDFRDYFGRFSIIFAGVIYEMLI